MPRGKSCMPQGKSCMPQGKSCMPHRKSSMSQGNFTKPCMSQEGVMSVSGRVMCASKESGRGNHVCLQRSRVCLRESRV